MDSCILYVIQRSIALSGKARTPGGGTDLAAMMGREETLKRVKDALGKL